MEVFPWWTEDQEKFSQEIEAFVKEIMPRDAETRWKREFPGHHYGVDPVRFRKEKTP